MIRSRLSYALAVVAGGAFYLFYNEWLSWFTLVLILCLPPVSLALSWPAARKVRLSVRAEPPAVQKEETVRFVVSLTNEGWLPVACCRFTLRARNAADGWDKPHKAAVFLAGGSQRQVEFFVSSRYAGKLECRVERALCCDYLGLFTCKRFGTRKVGAFVMPKVVPILPTLAAALVSDRDGDHNHPEKAGEDHSETFDIRPYREGDSLRAVHWKLSGRAEELMIREFARPVSDAVELLLDLCGDIETQDTLLDAFCSLHHFLEEMGVSHRVSWFDAPSEELQTRQMISDDDWAGALGAVLSAGRSRGAALRVRAGGPQSARVLYLCGIYGKAEQNLLEGLESALALVIAEDGEEAPKGSYPLRRERLREDLSALTI